MPKTKRATTALGVSRSIKEVLSSREVEILAHWYTDRWTLEDLAQFHQVSDTCILQWIRKAVDKLTRAGIPEPRKVPNMAVYKPWINLGSLTADQIDDLIRNKMSPLITDRNHPLE